MGSSQSTFKGNKSYLPSKLCVICKKEMTWRKSWEKNWESVKYCSDACRKNAPKIKS
ncbi:DUF2256 domain-containing protein [Polynucleobacter sp. 15G-AUS-farblos]|uniref:DUF2256 domain-containing protein n=1 Tax=Polynucleobacter sp. 15G-AUS-farblos TaxID=2689094 RepID=UPI001C0E6E4C|nr:DUF2256 domain-containing protein [Polynucleobacter sp. 15G-AUS-farblos]MBU3584217.1 DUF2256 domain-containing protein [Polynucleobacter sp. 15G-AUS-farblos]